MTYKILPFLCAFLYIVWWHEKYAKQRLLFGMRRTWEEGTETDLTSLEATSEYVGTIIYLPGAWPLLQGATTRNWKVSIEIVSAFCCCWAQTCYSSFSWTGCHSCTLEFRNTAHCYGKRGIINSLRYLLKVPSTLSKFYFKKEHFTLQLLWSTIFFLITSNTNILAGTYVYNHYTYKQI